MRTTARRAKRNRSSDSAPSVRRTWFAFSDYAGTCWVEADVYEHWYRLVVAAGRDLLEPHLREAGLRVTAAPEDPSVLQSGAKLFHHAGRHFTTSAINDDGLLLEQSGSGDGVRVEALPEEARARLSAVLERGTCGCALCANMWLEVPRDAALRTLLFETRAGARDAAMIWVAILQNADAETARAVLSSPHFPALEYANGKAALLGFGRLIGDQPELLEEALLSSRPETRATALITLSCWIEVDQARAHVAAKWLTRSFEDPSPLVRHAAADTADRSVVALRTTLDAASLSALVAREPDRGYHGASTCFLGLRALLALRASNAVSPDFEALAADAMNRLQGTWAVNSVKALLESART